MKFKKIAAAFTAAAMAVTMAAASAFAATVEMDSEYVGAWGAGKCIPKTELEAIGGDVKVTLDIETRNLAGTADQFLLAPMDYDNSWTRITDQLTTEGEYAKADGFVVINENQTSCEFVITADTIASLGDSGLGFQVQNVIIKSAELEAGSPESAFTIIDEAQVADYCFGDLPSDEEAPAEEAAEEAPAEEAAPAETEAAPAETEAAPAADSNTTSTTTGNVPVAAVAVVMTAAGAAALISKRK
ncbi:MAG: hypothetical protein NC120_00595 [Ruminococcus sp.]|nr:hypothetical protein [Ruminococcus sp.]